MLRVPTLTPTPTQELRLRPHKLTFSRVREKVARRAG